MQSPFAPQPQKASCLPLAGQTSPESSDSVADGVLVCALTANDSAAFDRLFARYSPQLLSYLSRLVAGKCDPEDLLQETFLRVLTHAANFKAGMPVRPWLYTIARNIALNALRHHKMRAELEVSVDRSDWHPPSGLQQAGEPSGEMERQEQREKVLVALEQLPPLHREAIVLMLFEQFTYQEAASITGESEGTLRSRMFYALRKLRDRLKEHA